LVVVTPLTTLPLALGMKAPWAPPAAGFSAKTKMASSQGSAAAAWQSASSSCHLIRCAFNQVRMHDSLTILRTRGWGMKGGGGGMRSTKNVEDKT
jgi:hypothetical protein